MKCSIPGCPRDALALTRRKFKDGHVAANDTSLCQTHYFRGWRRKRGEGFHLYDPWSPGLQMRHRRWHVRRNTPDPVNCGLCEGRLKPRRLDRKTGKWVEYVPKNKTVTA